MRRPVHSTHGIRHEPLTLNQPTTQTRQRGLSNPHRVQREIPCRHVIHPFLNEGLCEVAQSPNSSQSRPCEDEKLFQIPAIGLHASFRLPSLFKLVLTKLFHQFN